MKIGLMVCGLKGELVLQSLLQRNMRINFVCSYDDKSTSDKSFENIRSLCDEHEVPFLQRKDDLPSYEVEKIFVIGWQFLIHEHQDKLIVFHDSYMVH